MNASEIDLIRQRGMERLEELCSYLVPHGHKKGHYWWAGSLHGEPGTSWNLNLRTGLFGDWASREKMKQGPIDLWKAVKGTSNRDAITQLADWLGSPVRDDQPSQLRRIIKPTEPPREVRPLDWDRFVAQMRPERQKELCAWRGYSPDYVIYLVASRKIGALRQGGWALPVIYNDQVVSAHCRMETAPGKPVWFYHPAPSNLGIPIQPLVHGNIEIATRVHAFESPWDQMALGDRLGIECKYNVSTISTRGARNAELLKAVPRNAHVILWPQNDEAGQIWLSDAMKALEGCKVDVARTPGKHKDVGEWVKSGADQRELERAFKKKEVFPSGHEWVDPREFYKPHQLCRETYSTDREMTR